MASSKDDDTTSKTRRNDPANPFVAFRRFADEQMASVLHTFFGQLPKSKAAERPGLEDDLPWIAQAMTDEQRRRLRRLREEPTLAEAYGMPTNEFYDQQGTNARGPENEPERCPYRPAHQEVPEQNRSGPPPELTWKPFPTHSEPDVPEDAPPHGSKSWVDDYMCRSLYSPLVLERSDRSGEEGAKWRHAFDDLIALQEGRAMTRPDAPHPQSARDPWDRAIDPDKLSEIADQWAAILGLEAQDKLEPKGRGIMFRLFRPENDIAEDAYANEDHQGGFDDVNDDEDVYDNDADDDDGAITGQDWYMRLLKDDPTSLSAPLVKAMARQAFRDELGDGTENTNTATNLPHEGPKPGITSTLTTTQRTTLPDGTVHTKMVLKKRFADGREESAETTHTTHGRQEQQLKQVLEPTAEMLKAVKDGEAEKPKEKKKAGWFWN